MKDPNLSELIRICIRCWLYLVPQAFLGIHLFSMFMRKKHSMKPLMIWQLLRVILIGGISDIILRGYYGNESWWEILMMFARSRKAVCWLLFATESLSSTVKRIYSN